MQRSIHARPGLGAALQIVQEGGLPLRRVLVEFPALVFVRAGRKRIRSAGVTVTANSGEMVAVEAGSEIEVTNALPPHGPYEAFCLALDPQLCGSTENLPAKTRVISPAVALGRPPSYLLSAFERAVASCEKGASAPDRILRHHLQEVLIGLELLGWRFDASGLGRTSNRVRRLLGADLSRGWRIGAVGKSLGMSEATLRRRLGEEGLSFRAILGQVRMGRALALLQSSNLSVTQVAYEVGYESVSQFTAKFRRHFGQSPRRLREPRAQN